MDGADSTPPTEAGSGGGNEEVGKGMGQRGSCDRSGGTLGSTGVLGIYLAAGW
jgi:hypothetical protein